MENIIFGLGYLNFVVVLCLLIFVHEAGHYVAARFAGIRVEVFSVGFGPELVGYTDQRGTRWRLSVIPFGGYVKMYGEMIVVESPVPSGDADTGSRAGIPKDAFNAKKPGARALAVLGGPLANFIYAILVLWGVFWVQGHLVAGTLAEDGIGPVLAGSPAERAGLQHGDRIVSVDGIATVTFEEFAGLVRASEGRPLNIIADRPLAPSGSFSSGTTSDSTAPTSPPQEWTRLQTQVLPEWQKTEAGTTYRLGVYGPVRAYSYGPLEALGASIQQTASISGQILVSLGELVTGRRGTEELGGPVRIAELSRQAGSSGLAALVSLTVLLSINLGLLNLLPIPALDGGHLLMIGLEKVLGRPLPERIQAVALQIGVFLLIGLMVFVTINDFFQLLF